MAGQRDLPDQLQKLAELRDSGALSPQEFEQAKARMISGLMPSEVAGPTQGRRVAALDHFLVLLAVGLIVLWVLIGISDFAVKVVVVGFLEIVWAGVALFALRVLAALGLYTGFMRLK
jgi:hypothetical protein